MLSEVYNIYNNACSLTQKITNASNYARSTGSSAGQQLSTCGREVCKKKSLLFFAIVTSVTLPYLINLGR